MKISDFLRMKITPDNKQFDMIKNIRFLNEKNDILVGKGTVTIKAFCDSFFDYVYRNFGNARSAEKLIKANRKKYQKFSGSESMILVQRILNEIAEEYAISNYHITCEMDNTAVKKTPVQDKAKEQNTAPVQQVQENQNVVQVNTVSAPVNAQVKPEQNPANINANNQKARIDGENAAQNAASVKIKALESELVRMQPNAQVEVKQTVPEVMVMNTESAIQEVITEPQIELPQENNFNDQAIQPEIPNMQIVQPESVQTQVLQQENVNIQVAQQETTQVQAAQQEVIQPHEMPQTQIVQPEAAQAQIVQPKTAQAQAVQQENVKPQMVQQQATVQVQTAPEQAPKTQNNQNEVQASAPQKPAVPENTKKGGQDQYNGSNKKNRKDKDKRPPIEEARLRPGKGIPPIKDLKPVARFQNAAVTKSKLNLDEIPCIAVIEENIVPTMEEVPFIGVPEDNSVPSMKDVPYVGVDEFGNPVESRSIYLQIDTPENTEPAPEIRKEKTEVSLKETPAKEEKVYDKPTETVAAKPVEATVSREETPVPKAKKNTHRSYKDLKKIVANAIENNKQVVFTGPSGTGKTYQVRKYARTMTKGYNGFKFVQFHPGYEYSDFVEGMRPANIVNSNVPTNVRLDGVFKAFCRMIVEDNLESAIPGFSSMYSEKKQKVLQGLYEKIRDKKEDLDEGRASEGFDHDSEEYIFENGVRDYYFIIDELNRADLTRVFGDVLFALDEDYRGIENRFDTRLANLKSYRIVQADDIGKANYSTSHIGFAEQMKFDCFERGFFIPKNLHIIGTMNEIESSSESIGFAFRHKFRWVYIDPEEIMLTSLRDIHKDKDIFWLDRFAENLNRINVLISESFSSEYRLGPAYFRKLNEAQKSIDDVFETTIEPLLKEYLKGQPLDITERFISECHKALHIGI